MHSTCVVWFRRDLRLQDNPALTHALNSSAVVIPLYIWHPEEDASISDRPMNRNLTWLTKELVEDLSGQIARKGSFLYVVQATKSYTEVLLEMSKTHGVDLVCYNRISEPAWEKQDADMAKVLLAHGVSCAAFDADHLYEPTDIVDKKGKPYSNWLRYLYHVKNMMNYEVAFPLPTPLRLPRTCAAAEDNSHRRVEWFKTKDDKDIANTLEQTWRKTHKQLINSMWRERVFYFGPYLYLGAVSVRTMWYSLAQSSEMAVVRSRAWMDELHKRDYVKYLAYHGYERRKEMPKLNDFKSMALRAWQLGITGVPIVDAGIRQLNAVGWVQREMRNVLAHFLVGCMGVPSVYGIRYLMETMIDPDRIAAEVEWDIVKENPICDLEVLSRYAKSLDQGGYVRRWLPVLSRATVADIQSPWNASKYSLDSCGVELGQNFPRSIMQPRHDQRRVQSHEVNAYMSSKDVMLHDDNDNTGRGLSGADVLDPNPLTFNETVDKQRRCFFCF